MAGGGESLIDWVYKLLNFAVLVGILVVFAGKPLKNFLANRHNAVKEKLEEANRMIKEAEAVKVEYANRLARLDEEIETFKKVMIQETEKERKKIFDEAEAFAARIKEQAKITYEQEIREVKARIREEIARLTMERAEKLVAERVNKADHDHLVEEFIEKLRSLN
jgi:F-type H+-transporting ATPase subunit b